MCIKASVKALFKSASIKFCLFHILIKIPQWYYGSHLIQYLNIQLWIFRLVCFLEKCLVEFEHLFSHSVELIWCIHQCLTVKGLSWKFLTYNVASNCFLQLLVSKFYFDICNTSVSKFYFDICNTSGIIFHISRLIFCWLELIQYLGQIIINLYWVILFLFCHLIQYLNIQPWIFRLVCFLEKCLVEFEHLFSHSVELIWCIHQCLTVKGLSWKFLTYNVVSNYFLQLLVSKFYFDIGNTSGIIFHIRLIFCWLELIQYLGQIIINLY